MADSRGGGTIDIRALEVQPRRVLLMFLPAFGWRVHGTAWAEMRMSPAT